MKNKILFLLLCVFMLAAISPLSIFAAEGDTVTVYFMARGGNTADKTQPITSYNCSRLTVPAGTTVSDVTYAIENNTDSVVSGSGLSYYETLFGQGSGLTGPSSGWLYYVDSYNTLITAANEYTVYDGMFILWEYVSDFDENWDAVIYEPVDFEAMRALADSRISCDMTSDVLRGDSNGDGKVTADDAAAVLQYTRFADSITIDLDVSDYDRSGILTANDAAWILNRTLNNAA